MSSSSIPPGYAAVTRLAGWAAPALAPFSSKVREGLALRARSAEEWTAWCGTARDPRRPLLLLHAASAGELRQAEPVLARLRRGHPDWQLVVSSTSPSTAHVVPSLPIDLGVTLPWDTPSETRTFIEALAPTALVFSHLDLWPALVAAAVARGTRLGVIAARVRGDSSRLAWPARQVFRSTYASLELIGAIDADDAERLIRLGVLAGRIRVLGDPRFDSVVERTAGRPAPRPHPTTLVAGSTWPDEERILLATLGSLHHAQVPARLVLAPHRPGAETAHRIAALARRVGLAPPRDLHSASDQDSLVVVNELGRLADLYGEGVIAYVGGGFRRGGLHSVLESAVWGVPTITGPEVQGFPEALLLRDQGALMTLPRRGAATTLEAWWETWLTNTEAREEAGRTARRTVREYTGAAERCARLIEDLMPGPTSG